MPRSWLLGSPPLVSLIPGGEGGLAGSPQSPPCPVSREGKRHQKLPLAVSLREASNLSQMVFCPKEAELAFLSGFILHRDAWGLGRSSRSGPCGFWRGPPRPRDASAAVVSLLRAQGPFSQTVLLALSGLTRPSSRPSVHPSGPASGTGRARAPACWVSGRAVGHLDGLPLEIATCGPDRVPQVRDAPFY